MSSSIWRPWDFEEQEEEVSIVYPAQDIAMPVEVPRRKRVTIGDKERDFVVQCYNKCTGKDWANVLKYLKQHVLEAGLPEHTVHMYLNQAEERLTGRMSRIVKQALQNAPQVLSSSSKLINESVLVGKEMKYARRMTPNERKTDAVKLKLNETIDDSSSDSGGEDEPLRKKKKTAADEAQEAHKQMCEKAITTMDSVQQILKKIDDNLKK